MPAVWIPLIHKKTENVQAVDDTIIGFEEFRPKIESFETFDDYGGSDVHGPGKIYQYVTKGEYLDHTFYFEITDTIYTPKK